MNTMLIKSIYGKGITAFKPSKQVKSSNRSRHQVSAKVGLFYSTSTGNTQAAAEWIQEKFAKHGDIAAPVDICEAKVSDMQDFDSLIGELPPGIPELTKAVRVRLGMTFWTSSEH